MAEEIERKFLVTDQSWFDGSKPIRIRQGYLAGDSESAVRIRLSDDSAWLTIKHRIDDRRRWEFEYPIPLTDAKLMLENIPEEKIIKKLRYRVEFTGQLWEVDVFEGLNRGLIVAEVELESAEQEFEIPPWAGVEITAAPRYLNTNLARDPYTKWKQN